MIRSLARRFVVHGVAAIALLGACHAVEGATVKLSCRVHVTQEKAFLMGPHPKEQTAMDELITVRISRVGNVLMLSSLGSEADFAVQAEPMKHPGEMRHGDIVDVSSPDVWYIAWETGDSTHPADNGSVRIDRNTGQLAYTRMQFTDAFALTTNMAGPCEKADVNKRKF